jgi:hypothetical protein
MEGKRTLFFIVVEEPEGKKRWKDREVVEGPILEGRFAR